MISILIITHGSLSKALLESASMFVSNTEGVCAVSFYPGQGVEELIHSVRDALSKTPGKKGCLALVDMPGGSPARAAGTVLSELAEPMEIVSGVNLTMLVETLLMRDSMTLSELAEHAVSSGNDGIVNVGKTLREARCTD